MPGDARDEWVKWCAFASLPFSALALVFALALGACGGGGGTLRAGVYVDEEASYRVGTLGPGWDQIDLSQNDLAWHSDGLGSVVQVNATCDPFSDVPLTSLTNHLLIGFTEREYKNSALVALDGREALRTHVVARFDGVPREIVLYVLKKDTCTYDFALIAPPGGRFSAAETVFDAFVQGFSSEARRP